ncbi:hypothetical protein CP8484711_1317B, partial [Chlamydia psittaci 84-8471/1]
QKHSV